MEITSRKANTISKTDKAAKALKTVKSGFSVIEVMLVLGISGLMLVGLLAGTFSSIANQRYNDAIRSFAEFFRSVYNEVISPESLGTGNSATAVLGKIIVFDPSVNGDNGDRQAYTATIIGSANINLNPIQPNSSIVEELAKAKASIYCGTDLASDDQSTVSEYMALWQTSFMQGKNSSFPTDINSEFRGTFIIARSPASNVVHTAFSPDLVYNLKDNCNPTDRAAEYQFKNNLQDAAERSKFSQDSAINICVKSTDVRFMRAVRIAADGRNSSAVSVINTEELEEFDPEAGGGNPCQ